MYKQCTKYVLILFQAMPGESNIIALNYLQNIPTGDNGLYTLAVHVLKNLNKYPAIEVSSVYSEMLEEGISGLKKLKTAKVKNVLRQPLKPEIISFQKKIETGVDFVQAYLQEKFGLDNSKTHYAAFGIVRTPKGYELPGTLSDKKNGMLKLMEGLQQFGLSDKKFGCAFWQSLLPIIDDLILKQTKLSEIEAWQEQSRIGSREIIMKSFGEIIETVIHKYPDSYPKILRLLGFQLLKTD
jgi:hypothetical protein